MPELIEVEQILRLNQTQAEMLQRWAVQVKELQETVQRLTAERDQLQTALAEAKQVRREYSEIIFKLAGHEDDEEKILQQIAEIQRNPVGRDELVKIIEELERASHD